MFEIDEKLGKDYIRFKAIPREELEAYFQNANVVFKIIQDSCHRIIFNWARGFAGRQGWIIDIGCGAGAHFNYVHKGAKLLGIDSDIRALKIAKKRHPKSVFIAADMSKLPFKDGSVVSVVSFYALEHVSQIDEALKEVYRILKENCSFFVGLPLEGGFLWNTGRRLTSEREFSRRYGIDYSKVIKIEHCNTARRIIDNLRKIFILKRKSFFPLSFFPFINCNLTVSIECVKKGLEN